MNEREIKGVSKFLSLVLRHKPETIGLTLDANGWADVNELIEKMNAEGIELNHHWLTYVVATNSKQRFAFDESKTKIRASQGHSIQVELNLQQKEPPAILYHGTSEMNVPSIMEIGLHPSGRQHVHLSSDKKTALVVGQRHGKPKVLAVAAQQMSDDGFAFYLSENKVWLAEEVPARYLRLL